MSMILDWSPEKAAAFGHAELAFQHDLHCRPMFDDEGLEGVLDRYPRDKLGVFTMGADPVDWRSWRRGAAGDLSGAELLEAARRGRIWLNLRGVNHHLPEYEALSDEMFADIAAGTRGRGRPGLRTFKRDLGLLISSANAQVFYHLDVALVTLWQLRGRKTAYIYPPEAPYVGPEQLEAIVLRETAEQFAYEPGWDARAEVFEMTPGAMVTWRQNAPHRIVNADCLNVSLSVEFMTPDALLRANAVYANGLLRRKLGMAPSIPRPRSAALLGKAALARAAKAVRREPPAKAPLAPTFRVGGADGTLAPL